MGLLGLLGLLEGVLGFPTLLEGGLQHVVPPRSMLGELGGFPKTPYIRFLWPADFLIFVALETGLIINAFSEGSHLMCWWC